jgi:hypothetical protein
MTVSFDRALSIQQPWGWLIAHGYKDIENRDWLTWVRGPVGIHVGRKFDRAGYDWVRSTFPDIPMPVPTEFERGGLIGSMVIVECVAESTSPWFFGKYGFVIRDARPMPFVPCRGMLGFFRVPQEG